MLHGARLTLKVTADDTRGAYAVVEAVQPPSYVTPYHIHRREHEALFVLEGELEVCIDGQVATLGPGDFLHAPPLVPHSLANSSDRNNRFLCFFSPAGFEEFVRAAGSPASPSEPVTRPTPPANREAFLEVVHRFGQELAPPPQRLVSSLDDDGIDRPPSLSPD